MASVFDVAAFILERTGQLGTLKLQKLVYYSQAWSLVWDGAPLFSERIEAWKDGPVVRDLYRAHRGLPFVDHLERGSEAALSSSQRLTIMAVLDFYGRRDGQWLSELSHREPPWRDAIRKSTRDKKDAQNPAITPEAMREFFSTYPAQHRSIPASIARGLELLVALPRDVVPDVLSGESVAVDGLEQWLESGKGNPWLAFDA